MRRKKGVRRATSNSASGSVTLDYDETVTSVERLRRKVNSCGFRCRCTVTPRHVCKLAVPAPSEARPAQPSHRGHARPHAPGGGRPWQTRPGGRRTPGRGGRMSHR
ncbi:MAG TPA: hypothetical protein VMP03_10390 [Methylomirabilota bacterium]|nr:hypothetical protein [Methylomirabilota bacterium]